MFIAELLIGSENAKMRAEHKKLKTYGIGKEHPTSQWIDMIKEMKELGFLKQSTGEYPVILLGDSTDEILKGQKEVFFTKYKVVDKQKIIKLNLDLPHIESDLFEALRNLRKKIADIENVPAFVIFSDSTLNEMSAYLPMDEKDLYKISGWGEVKIKKYSKQFLPIVIDYCNERQLKSRIESKKNQTKKKSNDQQKRLHENDTKKESYSMFLLGKSIPEIAKERNLHASTIENHLVYYVAAKFLDVHKFVSAEKINTIKKVCTDKGADSLKIIKEELGENYSYNEIRMAIASF